MMNIEMCPAEKLGWGRRVGGVVRHNSPAGTAEILDTVTDHTDMTPERCLVYVGSGLGR